MDEQLKKAKEEIEYLKKENEKLVKSLRSNDDLGHTIRELYAALGSKKQNIKILQKRGGVPVLIKIISQKETDSGIFIEVAE